MVSALPSSMCEENAWQARPLTSFCPMIYLDAIIVKPDLTSTGLVLGNPEGVEDFSGVVGDGGLGFDRVTVDGDGDVA